MRMIHFLFKQKICWVEPAYISSEALKISQLTRIVYSKFSSFILFSNRSLEKVNIYRNDTTNSSQDMAYIHSSVIRIRIKDTYTVVAPCITIEPTSRVEPGHLVEVYHISIVNTTLLAIVSNR